MTKRIAFVIPTLDQSGAEKQLALLATHLPPEEFSCRVIVLTRGGPYESLLRAAGIDVRILGKRFKFDPWAYRKLRRELTEFQPEIIHTWLFAANTYGRYAASAVPAAKVIVSERCVDSWKAGWQKWFDRRLIDRTDRLVGNSPSVVDFYRELGVPEEKLVYIPNGIELPDDEPASSSERSLWRKELGFPEDAFVVGYVGRIAPQKSVRDLIWAVETLRQIRSQCRLVIAGDGPERPRLERFVQSIHAENHVRFLGHVSQPAAIYRQLDTFCLASRFEGMSNSLLEAMSWGLPCVASQIPPNAALVEHGQTGLLFRPGDAVAIMQALRTLIDEPPTGQAFGQAARQHIATRWTVGAMTQQWIDLYRQILGQPPA